MSKYYLIKADYKPKELFDENGISMGHNIFSQDEFIELTKEELQHILQMDLYNGNIMANITYKNGSLKRQVKFTNTQEIKKKIWKVLGNE